MKTSSQHKPLIITANRKHGQFIRTFKVDESRDLPCPFHNIILTPEGNRLKRFQEVYQKSV